jgi:SAM-dependent methyltransferase
MVQVDPALAGHPDRVRWNARYSGGFCASFRAHPLVLQALSMPLVAGSVLDLASGPSGSALFAARAGRQVLAVDASDVALDMLAQEAERRRLTALTTLVQADLGVWRPEADTCALVLCTSYWDRELFPLAARAVRPGGLLAWEAYTVGALHLKPGFSRGWCVDAGEPASLLPAGWQILTLTDSADGARRRLLAKRDPDSPPELH